MKIELGCQPNCSEVIFRVFVSIEQSNIVLKPFLLGMGRWDKRKDEDGEWYCPTEMTQDYFKIRMGWNNCIPDYRGKYKSEETDRLKKYLKANKIKFKVEQEG